MKILLVNHEAVLGGAVQSLLELTKELIKRGHEIYVLTPYNDGRLKEEMRKLPVRILVEPYWWWRIPTIGMKNNMIIRAQWFLRQRKRNEEIARRIATYAIGNHIEIIHSNTSVVNIGALISKYSGLPHVWHLREFGDLDMNMHFLDNASGAYRFMNCYTKKFICVSKAVAAHYHQLDSAKKLVVYNGVSDKYILNQSIKKERDVVNLLIAGTISPYKGQSEAVKACGMLLQRGIDRFRLHVAGRRDLHLEIPEKLKNYVIMHGEISDMRELRKSMDIELVCSRCEAFGRVTAEGMLGGLAVIGSDCGGTPELIQNGVNGYLYEKGNAEHLSNRLEQLIKDEKLRKQFGKKAQDYAKKHFLMERCAADIENIYKSVL